MWAWDPSQAPSGRGGEEARPVLRALSQVSTVPREDQIPDSRTTVHWGHHRGQVLSSSRLPVLRPKGILFSTGASPLPYDSDAGDWGTVSYYEIVPMQQLSLTNLTLYKTTTTCLPLSRALPITSSGDTRDPFIDGQRPCLSIGGGPKGRRRGTHGRSSLGLPGHWLR